MPTDEKKAATVPADEKKPTVAERIEASKELAANEREARETPADIKPAKNTAIEASGSIMEGDVKAAIPVDHPAVDNNPRAGTTEIQNKADFNDPTLDSEEAVKENLAAQRSK